MYPDWQRISSSLGIEPFAALFWALGMHCTRPYTETVGPACRPRASLNSGTGQGSVRFNLIEDASATCLFRSCYIIYL